VLGQTQTLVDARTSANVLGRIMRMVMAHPFRMGIASLATLVAAIAQLFVPRFLGQAVDRIFVLLQAGATWDQARAGLVAAGVGLLVASSLRGLLLMVHNMQGEIVGQAVAYRLRLRYYAALQRFSYSFHDRAHTGDLMTRGMLDIEGVALFVNSGLLKALLLVALVGAGTILLVSTDATLTLAALGFVPIVAWLAGASRLRLREMWYQLQRRMSVLTRVMDENLTGIRVVRAFTAQNHELAKFDRASKRAYRLVRKRVRVRVNNGAAMTFVYYLAMAGVLLLGGSKVIAGELSVGNLTEFLAFMTILQQPVRQIGNIVNAIARASSSGQRLFEVLDTEPAIIDRPDAAPLQITRGALRFDNVSFSYRTDDGSVPALQGVSFEVERGRTLGIVGPPGAGKSTIAHLLPRLYDVDSGAIEIDGQDIRSVTLESLRRAVGVIQQDSFMFTASVETNVAYGDPWAVRERISHATSSAQLRDYIERLPMQYSTLVGERGVSLSGGQRQRLSIARGVLLHPAVVVFDDSTAAIDAGTELRIRRALRDVTAECATIIIAHRLSSLMHADEILFIDHGQVLEHGSHDALLAAGGHYAGLFELQSRVRTS
jgi:ATP-binding cassette subfamily B multidrug efflux pump